MVISLCSSPKIFAQIDLSMFATGDCLSKAKELLGDPLGQDEFDGESGEYIELRYPFCLLTLLKPENSFENIFIWDNGVSVLSNIVSGGIKIGDNVSLFKDIDFSKEVTGKHYEENGFIPIPSPQRSFMRADLFYNYKILSHGKPYFVKIATENGVIKEIRVAVPLEEYRDESLCPEDSLQKGTIGGML